MYGDRLILRDYEDTVGICFAEPIKLTILTSKELLSATCLSVENDLILIGTDGNGVLECQTGSKTSISRHSIEGCVSSVKVSPDLKYFIAGNDKGDILVKKIDGFLKKSVVLPCREKVVFIQFTEPRTFVVHTISKSFSLTIKSFKIYLEITVSTLPLDKTTSLTTSQSFLKPSTTLTNNGQSYILSF